MKTIHRDPGIFSTTAAEGHFAGRMTKPIHFYCSAPRAKSVHLVGDFNGWDPNILPMKLREDGQWFLQVPLAHGHHHYRFLVDGKMVLDPRATGVAFDDANEKVSVIAVS